MKHALMLLGALALLSLTAAVAGPRAENQGEPSNVTIYFAPGATALTPAAAEVLDETAKTVKQCNAKRLLVTGYSDQSESVALNVYVATARAIAVKRALIERGVEPRLIYVTADKHPAQKTGPVHAAFIGDRRADIAIDPAKSINF